MATNRLTTTDDRPLAVHPERRLFDVEGMHCASCLSRVERALLAVEGVSEAHANLATNQVSVIVDPQRVTPAAIQLAVAQAGYRAQPSAAPEQAAERMVERERAEVAFWRRRFVVSLALLIPLWLVHRYWPSSLAALSGWIQLLLATPLQVYVGGPYFRGAWQRLRHLSTNMDTLIALGTGTAYVAGVVGVVSHASMLTFHDAAMILTFITLGKYLEAKAKGRASHAIRQLLELTPPQATLLVDGQIQEAAVAQVDVGPVDPRSSGRQDSVGRARHGGKQRRQPGLADGRVDSGRQEAR